MYICFKLAQLDDNKPQSISCDCPPRNGVALENVQASATKNLIKEPHTLALPENGSNVIRAHPS